MLIIFSVTGIVLVVVAVFGDLVRCNQAGEHLEMRNPSSVRQFSKGGNDTLYGYDRAPVAHSGSMK